jgi:hypothetical protein
VPQGEGDDFDDSWKHPLGSPSAITVIKPFVIDVDSKESPAFLNHAPSIAAVGGARLSDQLAVEHAALLTEDYIKWRSLPMAAPSSNLFRTTATVRLPRVRTKRAEALARANARHLLGCLIALGYPRASLSLDFFAFEEVCRALVACLEARRLGAERRYVCLPSLSSNSLNVGFVALIL